MSKITHSFQSKFSSYVGELDSWVHLCDVGEDKEIPEGKVKITSLGCRFDKVEPKQVYSIWALLDSTIPGWKGDYQFEYSWDEFLTCSCGHGACAGYFNGIRIHKKKRTYRLAGKKKDGYSSGVVGTGHQVVYLSRKEVESVRDEFLEMFKKDLEGIFKINDMFFTGAYGLERWGNKK
ncbi:hypothetical protein [Salmonella phage SSBI34]|nr:hypothetical protein [Salmonella phage SSBI34]